MPIFTSFFSAGETPDNLRPHASRTSQGSQIPPGHRGLSFSSNLATPLPSHSDQGPPGAIPFQSPASPATTETQQAPSPQRLNYEYNPDGSRRRSFLYPRLAMGMGIERLNPPEKGGYFRNLDHITVDGGNTLERVMLPSFELYVRRTDGQTDDNNSQPHDNSQIALRRLPARDSNPLHKELLEVKQIAAELYELVCKQWFPCPYQGCQCRFRSCDDQRIQMHFREAHTAIQCNFCSLSFLENTPVKDRMIHLATEHSDLFSSGFVNARLYMASQNSSGSGSSQQPKDKAAGGSASPQSSPGQRQSVIGIPGDSSKREEQILEINLPGRSPAKRPRREQDPTYRPPIHDEETEEDEEEDEGVEEEGHKDKRRRKAPRREPAVQQRAQPGQSRSHSQSHNRRADGRHITSRVSDPSYYPGRNGSLEDYLDDMDDELRRSAIWEWTRDARDPTGRRKRLLREPGTKRQKIHGATDFAPGAGDLQWVKEIVIAAKGKGKDMAMESLLASGESKALPVASASVVRPRAAYLTAQTARAVPTQATHPGPLRRSQRLQKQ